MSFQKEISPFPNLNRGWDFETINLSYTQSRGGMDSLGWNVDLMVFRVCILYGSRGVSWATKVLFLM